MDNGQIGARSLDYEAPRLVELGSFRELTLGCDKTLGEADGFTFQGQAIVCASA